MTINMEIKISFFTPLPQVVAVFVFLLASSNANEINCDRYHFLSTAGPRHIAHLNYPFNYTEKLTCKHFIYFPGYSFDSWQICFTFRRFHLENLSESGFGDYLEFPGQLRFSGNGSSAMDFSKAPPSPLPRSDPRSTVFYENLCFPLALSTRASYFLVKFHSVAKPLHVLGEWFGYYADYVTRPGLPAVLTPRLCNDSHSSCERFCYHGYKETATSNESCVSSCICNEIATETAPCDSSNQFMCFNRQCVAKSVVCDAHNDCSDGSDEGYWHARCPGSHNIEACSFEVGACQFEGINWSRSKSGASGPTSDNTFKTHYGGSFMLAEYAKSSYARLSYIATPVRRSSEHCLSFWYYFGGGPAGSLLVYIRTKDDQEPSLVWRRDYVPSTSRLSWLPGTISLPDYVFPIHEIMFEARDGDLGMNVIAIDDISFLEGSCNRDDITCSFELDSCGWTSPSILSRTATWQRSHKSIGSADHLPTNQNNTNAYFIGCESIDIITANLYKAELWSPHVSPTLIGVYCLSFDFFLHCGSADNLAIYTVNMEGVRRKEWSKSCGPMIGWQHADLQLSTYIVPFRILVVASLGKYESVHVHFGLDDIDILPGYCRQPKIENLTMLIPANPRDECFEPKYYMCKNGQCIDSKLMCNRRFDCVDRSDEGPGCHVEPPNTGGGLIAHSPTNPMIASAVGITLGIVMGVALMVISIYCVIRRRRLMRRSRPYNGGSASDYFDHCDFAGPQSLLPPSYSSTLFMGPSGSLIPPPYHDDKKREEAPPAYEMLDMASIGGHGNSQSGDTTRLEESL